MADSVHLTVDAGIARVTLARPELRNAFNAEVIEQLHDVFTRITAADDVRAVVLAGEGKVFCGGADINWMRSSLDLSFDANVGRRGAHERYVSARSTTARSRSRHGFTARRSEAAPDLQPFATLRSLPTRPCSASPK